ncbi:hypothetical protein Bca101_010800 [Brassica carinata]
MFIDDDEERLDRSIWKHLVPDLKEEEDYYEGDDIKGFDEGKIEHKKMMKESSSQGEGEEEKLAGRRSCDQKKAASVIQKAPTQIKEVLTKENIAEPMMDIRRALLEADVSLLVVRRFVQTREHALLAFTLGVKQMICCCNKLAEGRPRATITALFLSTCRNVLGYSTQLPLSQEYPGSAVDFPLGNISFFFFSSATSPTRPHLWT